jgi:glycosyltransferase involved in cell wall biosynthesis
VDIVVPSKMLTALVSGACIVAACSPGSAPADMIEASGGGHVVPAEDEHSLAETLRRIARGEMDTSTMRRRAREYAIRTFDRQNVYGPIAAKLLTRLS